METLDLALQRAPEPVALIIGNYDGVHIGHQAIIARGRELARRDGLGTALLSFEPHPLKVLAPERAPRLILTPSQKKKLLAFHGIDYYLEQPFDRRFSELSPEDFVIKLREQVIFDHVLVGFNFRFGHKRAGDIDTLRAIGKASGFQVHVADARRDDLDVISSSRIRSHIHDGDLITASRLLGRPYFLDGRVISGRGLGKQLRSPTANIVAENELLPRFGVYASWSRAGETWFRSITNIGNAPTVSRGKPLVETRLFDFKGNLYGKMLTVCPGQFLRSEQRFEDLDTLKAQIAQDTAQRQALDDHDPPRTTFL